MDAYKNVLNQFQKNWAEFSELFTKFKSMEITEKEFLLSSSFIILNTTHVATDVSSEPSHLYTIESPSQIDENCFNILNDEGI